MSTVSMRFVIALCLIVRCLSAVAPVHANVPVKVTSASEVKVSALSNSLFTSPNPLLGFPNPLFTWGGTADPGMLVYGSTYYAASTSGVDSAGVMPIRASSDRLNWSDYGCIFRPGKIPAWTDSSKGYWAPQIYYFSALGQFVAYYSGLNRSTGKRCIGRATSYGLDDFTDLGRPLLCHPTAAYSIIDQSLFWDGRAQKLYLLYKNDPPTTVGTKQIVIRSIANDGLSNIGTPYHILQPTQTWEGVSVEAPTMVYNSSDGYYYLFYSGATYSRDTYGVGAARSTSPIGSPAGADFTKYSGNPILSGNYDPGYCGVGHQDITWTSTEGWLIFYHAYLSQSGEDCTGGRYLMMDQLHWDNSGGWPRVHDGTPSE